MFTNLFRKKFDEVGEVQKNLESREAARKIMPGIPVICRLDGKAFHTFTRGLARPFDTNLQQCMQRTMSNLVEAFGADFGYTQSDEITLVWKNDTQNENFIYGGKIQKIVSLTAGAASVVFNRAVAELLPHKAHLYPVFDSRVWQVTNYDDVVANILWRQDDAKRNSITMAAQAYFSHNELHGVSTNKMLGLLVEEGIDWRDYNPHFKYGIFAKRLKYEVDPNDLQEDIPAEHRPNEPIIRSKVFLIDMPPFREFGDMFNFDFLFDKEIMADHAVYHGMTVHE